MELYRKVGSVATPGLPIDYTNLGYDSLRDAMLQLARQTLPDQGPKKFPWKVQAARLGDALKAMQADVKAHPDKATVAYVDQVLGQALRVLADIEVSQN